MRHSDSLSYRLLALMQQSLAGTGCITVVLLMIGQVQYSNRGILFWELYASLFFHCHCRRRQSFQGVWCSVSVDSLSLAGIKAYKQSVRKFHDSMIGVGLFRPSQDLEACCIRPEDCDFEDWNDWSSCAVQACGPASWQIQRCAVLELLPHCDECAALTAFSNHFHWLDVLSQGQWQWGTTLSDTGKGRSCEERHFGQQRIASRDLQELCKTLPKYWM